jgi:hypothetical protein
VTRISQIAFLSLASSAPGRRERGFDLANRKNDNTDTDFQQTNAQKIAPREPPSGANGRPRRVLTLMKTQSIGIETSDLGTIPPYPLERLVCANGGHSTTAWQLSQIDLQPKFRPCMRVDGSRCAKPSSSASPSCPVIELSVLLPPLKFDLPRRPRTSRRRCIQDAPPGGRSSPRRYEPRADPAAPGS